MHYIALKISTDNSKTFAFAGCWINDDDPEVALTKCCEMIKRQDWTILEILEQFEITRSNYSDGDEGLRYFQQATIDGEVCVVFKGGN